MESQDVLKIHLSIPCCIYLISHFIYLQILKFLKAKTSIISSSSLPFDSVIIIIPKIGAIFLRIFPSFHKMFQFPPKIRKKNFHFWLVNSSISSPVFLDEEFFVSKFRGTSSSTKKCKAYLRHTIQLLKISLFFSF